MIVARQVMCRQGNRMQINMMLYLSNIKGGKKEEREYEV